MLSLMRRNLPWQDRDALASLVAVTDELEDQLMKEGRKFIPQAPFGFAQFPLQSTLKQQ